MHTIVQRSLLAGLALLLLSACSAQESREEGGHESAGKSEQNCRTIKRTGKRTGLRVCDRD